MNKIEFGDCRETMKRWKEQGVKAQMCVTSPPYYGLRDYGHEGQIGLEPTPKAYIESMCEVFDCVWDILADDGTLWLNIGDSYAGNNSQASNNGRAGFGNPRERVVNRTGEGLKTKDLIGIPWMLAFALRERGWYLRQDIIWSKPNPMPESVKDRCTKAHEYIFLLSKSEKYFFDSEAMKEPCVTSAKDQIAKRNKKPHKGQRDSGMRDTTGGFDKLTKVYDTRNRRSVWTITTKPYKGAHFATFPKELIIPCILAGSRKGDIVLDPFMGSGTTAQVALEIDRQYLGCELNPEYKKLQDERIGYRLL